MPNGSIFGVSQRYEKSGGTVYASPLFARNRAAGVKKEEPPLLGSPETTHT